MGPPHRRDPAAPEPAGPSDSWRAGGRAGWLEGARPGNSAPAGWS